LVTIFDSSGCDDSYFFHVHPIAIGSSRSGLHKAVIHQAITAAGVFWIGHGH
jgi:hypothetical protein